MGFPRSGSSIYSPSTRIPHAPDTRTRGYETSLAAAKNEQATTFPVKPIGPNYTGDRCPKLPIAPRDPRASGAFGRKVPGSAGQVSLLREIAEVLHPQLAEVLPTEDECLFGMLVESVVSPRRAQLVIGRRTLGNGHLIGRPLQRNTGVSLCLLPTYLWSEQPGGDFSSGPNSVIIEAPVRGYD